MELEPFRKNDLYNIEALQPEGWPNIVNAFKFYLDSTFCLPIKASSNEKITGTGVIIFFKDTCWLAHIIVDPVFRKKGIGSQIVNHLLTIADKKSYRKKLLIATESGRSVYQKAGFREVTEYSFFHRQNPGSFNYDKKGVTPFNEKFRQSLLEKDQQVTGEDRSALLKPFLPYSLLLIKEGKLQGYYIPGLEEGPIIATNTDAGKNLMSIKYESEEKAVMPSSNEEGIEFLESNGFLRSSTKGTRMIKGPSVKWTPENIYSRIGGNFG